MKNWIRAFCLLGGGLYLLTLLYFFFPQGNAATITAGYTATNGTSVSASQFNQAFSGATLSGIASSDINSGAVTGPKLAVASVTGGAGGKIATNTVTGGTGGNLATNTVTTDNIADGTITGSDMNTAFVWPSGTVAYTNNVTLTYSTGQIASAAIAGTNAGGTSSQANLVPKLNSAGKLDPSLYYKSTNGGAIISSDTAAPSSYTSLASYTTVATNGSVAIFGQAVYQQSGGDAGPWGLRVIDNSGTCICATAMDDVGGTADPMIITCLGKDTLTGTAKTYTMAGIVNVGAIGNWIKNGTANGGTMGLTNATQLIVIEFPRP